MIPILIGDLMRTMLFWNRMFENGVFANAVVAPAVPPGMDLIRTSYMATHEDHHVDRILEVCEKVGREMGIIDPSRPSPVPPAAARAPAPAPSPTASPEA